MALLDDGRVALIDWSMMSLAPVAVELGWLLVSNSASLPIEPEAVLARYRDVAGRVARTGLRLGPRWPDADPRARRRSTLPPRGLDPTIGDWDAQRDLTWIVGLLMRGWRKGLDAEAGIVLGSGVRRGGRPRVVVRTGGRGGRPAATLAVHRSKEPAVPKTVPNLPGIEPSSSPTQHGRRGERLRLPRRPGR